jgi:TolB protein
MLLCIPLLGCAGQSQVPSPVGSPLTTSAPVVSPATSLPTTAPSVAVNHSPGLDGASNTIAFSGGSIRIDCPTQDGTVHFDSDIYTVAVDGRDLQRLTSAPGGKGWPSWSPDAKRITFRWATNGCDPNRSDIAIVTIADSKVTVLAHEGWSPAWSPLGDWIAYYAASSAFGLNLVRPDGSADHQILAGDAEYPAWSPDGRRIAFMSLGFPAGSSSSDYDLYVVDVDGTNLRRLTTAAGEDGWPDWSHDGRRIAYVHKPSEPTSEIHVMTADGRDDARVSDASDDLSEYAPTWSPNDLYLAYSAYPETSLDSGGIFVSQPDGQGTLRIRSDGSEPEWMPMT